MINQFESKLDTKLLDASLQKLASDFHCGNQYIDLFLRSAQALDDSFGKTYVWLNESGDEIIGFYNISAGSVDYLEDGYRYKMGGAIHINEFAIKQRYLKARGVTMCDIEMTPSKPSQETDTFEELILTPSLSGEQTMSADLVLEAEDIFKAEEITFEGQKEAESRIAEAMSAYDKAMDQAVSNI